jgi:hypothetical protein
MPGVLNELGRGPEMDPSARVKAESDYAKIPLCFEANRGQTDASVKFLTRGKGYTLFLTSSEAVISLQGNVVRMKLDGANAHTMVQGLELLPSQSNYITGNDPKKWHTNVERYSQVEYKQVYPGIDVVYYGNQGQLEYDFIVAPGANPALINLDFQGAQSLELDQQGNLLLNSEGGRLTFNAPTLYQKTGDVRQFVEGRFVLAGQQVRFEVGSYDKSKELIIDPAVTYSTYLGTTVEDRVNAMAVDAAGNVYMTGQTQAVADKFPGNLAISRFQASNGGAFDAFVIKLNPAGAIAWVTYYGGAQDDIGLGIGVDGSNAGGHGPKVYITGSTTGTLPSPYTQLGPGGGTDAFVAAFSGDGTALVYANEFGGPGVESGNGIAVDAAGNAYVTGHTTSMAAFSFPYTFAGGVIYTVGAAQTTGGGADDAFVSKFNAAGVLQYSTYLGGTGIDQGNAIAIDSLGNAYVTGQCADAFVSVAGYPTVFRNTINGGGSDIDAFIAKLDPTGATFVYKTYVGGSNIDVATSIALDSLNNVYITGWTMSADMPNVGSPFSRIGQTTNGGAPDAFVFKMRTAFTGVGDGLYFTYLGGSGIDRGFGIKVDGAFNAYVTGTTESPDFVSVGPGSQPETALNLTGAALGSTSDAFVAVIGNGGGNPRLFNTFIGGGTAAGSFEEGHGIGLDAGNNIYVSGWTASGLVGDVYPIAFPTVLPLYANRAGDKDGFVMKFSPAAAVTAIIPDAAAGGCVPFVYPSPARGSTAGISYCMAGSGRVNIRVYNEIGNLVDALEESKAAGSQASSIDVGKLASGVYFIFLKTSYDDGNTEKHAKLKFLVIH